MTARPDVGGPSSDEQILDRVPQRSKSRDQPVALAALSSAFFAPCHDIRAEIDVELGSTIRGARPSRAVLGRQPGLDQPLAPQPAQRMIAQRGNQQLPERHQLGVQVRFERDAIDLREQRQARPR